jgi:hypothetical protein
MTSILGNGSVWASGEGGAGGLVLILETQT